MLYSMKRLWEMFAVLGRRQQHAECRTENRLPAHGVATIRRMVSGAEPETVSLLGVSEHGLSFRSDLSIAAEQAITVETGADTLEAIVRHAYPDGQEFVVGAEICSRNGVELESPRELATVEADKP